jgi:multicomponent Na+:H+ antiporter subunit D
VVLFFRIVEIGFFTTSDAGEGRRTQERSITEAPFSMLLPLMISAISIIILGIYTNDIVTRLIAVIVPNG